MVLGGGAGKLKGGRHVKFTDKPSMANLLMTLMDKMDVLVERIGEAPARFSSIRCRYEEDVIAALLVAAPVYAQEAPSGDGSTPLHWAAYRDDLAKTDQLLRGGANVNATNDLGATPLWAASINGNVALIKRLLDAGANPNTALVSGETPSWLRLARERLRRAGPARQGANPNAKGARGQTALMWAVAQGHTDVIKALLAGRADVHAKSDSWSR